MYRHYRRCRVSLRNRWSRVKAHHEVSIARVKRPFRFFRKLRDAPAADLRNLATEDIEKNIGRLTNWGGGGDGEKKIGTARTRKPSKLALTTIELRSQGAASSEGIITLAYSYRVRTKPGVCRCLDTKWHIFHSNDRI